MRLILIAALFAALPLTVTTPLQALGIEPPSPAPATYSAANPPDIPAGLTLAVASKAPNLLELPQVLPPSERIEARVSISRQRMEVYHEGRKLFDWPVSTARKGKVTPIGTWRGAQWLSRDHRSRLYNNAPMPFAIFYNGNYAIHGTDQIRKLGQPASAGCVRLHSKNAKILFNMVRAEGKDNLRVVVLP